MDRPHQQQLIQQLRGAPHQKGTSTTQILALITLLPVGASVLALAGITLIGTLLGAAVAMPLFLLCSPVLVPAAIALAAAVTGILMSGAFGLSGLSSFWWVLNSFREATGREPLGYAMRRVSECDEEFGSLVKGIPEERTRREEQVEESDTSYSSKKNGDRNYKTTELGLIMSGENQFKPLLNKAHETKRPSERLSERPNSTLQKDHETL